MALVHSRVRRVIYGVRDPERGCLGSAMMLHTLSELNHNYRVFEGVCANECRQSVLGAPSDGRRQGCSECVAENACPDNV